MLLVEIRASGRDLGVDDGRLGTIGLEGTNYWELLGWRERTIGNDWGGGGELLRTIGVAPQLLRTIGVDPELL